MKKDKNRKKNKISRQKNLFYWSVLALPILQFVIFYIGVNLNSFALAFETFDFGTGFRFVGFSDLFKNFLGVFKQIGETQYLQQAFLNSILLFAVSLLVGSSLSLLFSFYIYKKRSLNKIFRVILFLPHVISNITMVIIYKYYVEQALPEMIYRATGREIQGLLSNPDTERATIIFFAIWISFGVTTLIYSGSMSTISPEIVEAAQLDGITPLKEFLLIDVPIIWPTIVVFWVSSIAGIFVNQMHLYSFYGINASNYSIWTIGYYLYRGISAPDTTLADYPHYAAFGLLLTFITIPITLLARWLLNRADSEKRG